VEIDKHQKDPGKKAEEAFGKAQASTRTVRLKEASKALVRSSSGFLVENLALSH
jgi:hypothetical protein